MADVVIIQTVHVGGVNEIAPVGDERFDDRKRLGFVRPAADGQRHGAQADGLEQQSGVAEFALLHGWVLPWVYGSNNDGFQVAPVLRATWVASSA